MNQQNSAAHVSLSSYSIVKEPKHHATFCPISQNQPIADQLTDLREVFAIATPFRDLPSQRELLRQRRDCFVGERFIG